MTIAQAMQRAVNHHQAGRFAEADQIYQRLLKQVPDYVPAMHWRGLLLMRVGQSAEAVAVLSQAVRLNPDSPDEHNTLGIAFKSNGQLDQSIAAYRQAVQLKPDFAEAYNNLGLALRAKGDLGGAVIAAQQAIGLVPDSPVAYNTLGMALANPGQSNEAIAAFTKAIELDPNYAQAHVNLAMRSLLTGDFARGWAEYEWRWAADAPSDFHPWPQSRWSGDDLRGRSIFLHSERGLGDTLQFVRYAPLVAGRGGRVILGVQLELTRLFKNMPGVEKVIARGEPLPHFDTHCPLLSLPAIFATDLNSIPCDVPYLTADAILAEGKKKKFSLNTNQLGVGLVWAGNPAHLNDRHRSIPLWALAPLSRITSATFYSLQKGPAAEELKSSPVNMTELSAELKDFADTAAVLKNLDLLITADTAVAHLAGAMGKPVWLLLSAIPDWRWLLHREDSPWYPTMRLFRQPTFGDWNSVVKRICAELQMLNQH